MQLSISGKSAQERWIRFTKNWQEAVPHLAGVVLNEADFERMLVKVRPDGTVLALVKSYGPDGGLVVAFGSGYGVIPAFLALDASIQGGNWRKDAPWRPTKEAE